MQNYLTINTDGGSRGNPGHAATGFVIKHQQKIVHQSGEYIGIATNNVAEYQAVIKTLQWLIDNRSQIEKRLHLTKESPLQLHFNLDSNLAVNQLIGNYKTKQPHLKDLNLTIHQLLQKLNAAAQFKHVYREFNSEPDALLNIALDNHLSQN